MYLELAFGPPTGASQFAISSLGAHFTYALCSQPQISFMHLSNEDVLNCNAYSASNEEVDNTLFAPALPNIATDSYLLGVPATFAFHSSEFRNYFPVITVSCPEQHAYPLVDALVYYNDGSNRRIALTLCAVRRNIGLGMQQSIGVLAVWHCSNLGYISLDDCKNIAMTTIAQYCAAQHYLIHRPVQVTYREHRTNYGTDTAQLISEQSPSFYNPAANDPAAYSQLALLKTIDLNPEPTAQTGTYERRTECWDVAGHYRHLANGNVIWIDSYRKGPGRNNPDATPITHEYTIP